jgi:AraC-like DNA-binding protein
MCKLHCSVKNSSCSYSDKEKNPTIEIRLLKKESVLQVSSPANEVIYILKGSILLFSEKGQNFLIPENHMFFFPKGWKVSIYPQSGDVRVLVVRFYDRIRFCDSYRIEDLLQYSGRQGWTEAASCPEYFIIEADRVLIGYMEILDICYHRGIRCMSYNTYKVKELLHILMSFYKAETLYYFFRGIVSADFEFSQQIYDKCDSSDNVSELAHAMNYSISGFEKKFRKVFGESPYQWMKARKAYQIHCLICDGKLNFKEISDQFGFASVSDFCNFVKREFGQTPREIRLGENFKYLGENFK